MAVLFIAIANIYHFLTAGVVNYPVNYLLESIIDTLIVCLLPIFGNNLIVRDLQKINLVSVLVHFYGFLIYMFYVPPDSYDYLLSCVAIIQWVRLLWIRYDDTNNTNNNFRCDRFYHAHNHMSRINREVPNKWS